MKKNKKLDKVHKQMKIQKPVSTKEEPAKKYLKRKKFQFMGGGEGDGGE